MCVYIYRSADTDCKSLLGLLCKQCSGKCPDPRPSPYYGGGGGDFSECGIAFPLYADSRPNPRCAAWLEDSRVRPPAALLSVDPLTYTALSQRTIISLLFSWHICLSCSSRSTFRGTKASQDLPQMYLFMPPPRGTLSDDAV